MRAHLIPLPAAEGREPEDRPSGRTSPLCAHPYHAGRSSASRPPTLTETIRRHAAAGRDVAALLTELAAEVAPYAIDGNGWAALDRMAQHEGHASVLALLWRCQ